MPRAFQYHHVGKVIATLLHTFPYKLFTTVCLDDAIFISSDEQRGRMDLIISKMPQLLPVHIQCSIPFQAASKACAFELRYVEVHITL